MASMDNNPDMPRNKISLCSCHKLQGKTAFFSLEKLIIGLFQRHKFVVFTDQIVAAVRPQSPVLQPDFPPKSAAPHQ